MKSIDLTMRPYVDEDEARLLDCLVASLGGGPAGARPPEYFRWKHLDGPFGRSFILLAEAEGRIAGVRAFMRWRFRSGERDVSAVRAVDTATHPDFQGQGIFTKLTLAALDELRSEGVDMVYNTPNDSSLPGYLKMGWQVIGRVPISVRVRRPVRFVRRFRDKDGRPGPAPAIDAPAASELLARSDLDALVAAANVDDARFHTIRDTEYLRWRYGAAPLLDYRALHEERSGSPTGLAIFRVRPRGSLWETTVSELIVRPGDIATARRLLARVRRAARVDHLATHFPPGSTAASAARRAGYLKVPGGLMFVTNPLQDGVTPVPTELRSWALSIGDLEVF